MITQVKEMAKSVWKRLHLQHLPDLALITAKQNRRVRRHDGEAIAYQNEDEFHILLIDLLGFLSFDASSRSVQHRS